MPEISEERSSDPDTGDKVTDQQRGDSDQQGSKTQPQQQQSVSYPYEWSERVISCPDLVGAAPDGTDLIPTTVSAEVRACAEKACPDEQIHMSEYVWNRTAPGEDRFVSARPIGCQQLTGAQDPVQQIISEFFSHELRIKKPAVQPTSDTHYRWFVHLPMVLASDDEQYTITSTTSSEAHIRFTPTEYVWDMGNGDTITTDTAGSQVKEEKIHGLATDARDYIQNNAEHTYTYEETNTHGYTVSLTITYTGAYTFDQDTWYPITGTLTSNTTTTQMPPVCETRVIFVDPDGDTPAGDTCGTPPDNE